MRAEMIKKDGVFFSSDYIGDTKSLEDGSETLLEMFMNVTKKFYKDDFLGTLNVEDQIVVYESYKSIFKKMKSVGKFLRELSFKGEDSPIIGIFSVNRSEWFITEYGIYAANMINCPLYSTFGSESIRYILNETAMEVCFVSGIKAKSLYDDVIKDNHYNLKLIVTYDKLSDELASKYNSKNIKVVHILEIYDSDQNNKHKISNHADEQNKIQHNNAEEGNSEVKDKEVSESYEFQYDDLPSGDSIATICYTSGTSGMPKGVILSHTNFVVQIAGFIGPMKSTQKFEIQNSDVYISYLPLAHVMERICTMIIIAKGAKIAFFCGNPKMLQRDMKMIRPTFVAGVPRVFNVFKEKIQEAIDKKNFIIRAIIRLAFKHKIKNQKRSIFTHWLWDWLVFNKIHKEFGGRIRGCLNGSAPLCGNVVEYLQAIFSSKILQGYGQTEGTAANILMTLHDHKTEHVGIPFPTNLIKLCPTDSYVGGMEGEIYLKGNNITKGYFKRDDLTKEIFDDGWLKTGDIGRIESDAFKIVGRIKEIFKTSLGEYIIPEKIENILMNGCIEDILVTAKSYGDYIVAIVVCKNPNISKEEVLAKLTKLGDEAFKQGKLTRFEIPRKIHVLRNDFFTYGELLTPTLKKKRVNIESLFEKEINQLYE